MASIVQRFDTWTQFEGHLRLTRVAKLILLLSSSFFFISHDPPKRFRFAGMQMTDENCQKKPRISRNEF